MSRISLTRKSRLLSVPIAALLGTTALSAVQIMPAYAQDDAAPAAATPAPSNSKDELTQEITITGSRIVRRDFSASSPLVTVTKPEI